jgi:hypothetical protein
MMSFTSRKKRPLDRRVEHVKDTSLIVIATEGEKTEKIYFNDPFADIKFENIINCESVGNELKKYINFKKIIITLMILRKILIPQLKNQKHATLMITLYLK